MMSLSVIDREVAGQAFNAFVANGLLSRKFISGRVRAKLLHRILGLETSKGYVADKVHFENFNLALGQGARIERSCRLLGSGRIEIQHGAVLSEGTVLQTDVVDSRGSSYSEPIIIVS